MRPRIFIGSSREGLPIATRIKEYFSTDFDCRLWSDDIFKFNDNYLETLMKEASLFDFGFLVFTKDDLIKSRGNEQTAPRDNVLFEYGLFLGRLGRERAFVIHDREVKLPSDLQGISLAAFECKENGEITSQNGTFEDLLKRLHGEIMEKVGLGLLEILPSTVLAIGYFENFLRPVCDYLVENGEIEFRGKKYDTGRLKIILPEKLNSDMKKKATLYFRKNGYTEFPIQDSRRSYPLYVAVSEIGDRLVLSDMPTTLNGVNKAIEMYLKKGHIGKSCEQQLLEERELGNFRMVLSNLIESDDYCKEYITIETADR